MSTEVTSYQLPTTSLPLVVIVGETGTGKTALALELAERLDGEIISADSWAVYKDFNIGTAKPTPEERKRAKFHLIDVVEATDGFSAAIFQRLANEAVEGIRRRGKVPILVGGTGLYVDSVIYDFSFLPPGTPEQRLLLNQKTLPQLLEAVATAGTNTDGIDLRNKRRLIRLLETDGRRPLSKTLRPGTLILGLQVPREELHARVARRVDTMLAEGLEDEVNLLSQRYGWDVEPMKGIGYLQWREYFEGSQNHETTRLRIISATMNLAKRQRTWFGRNNSIQWVKNPSKAVEIATTFLNKTD